MEFSVLMSIYVREQPKYLRECLESVLNQTIMPTEIVIVEDGPLNEELYAVLDEYEARYEGLFHRVPLHENVGLGKALAIGVQACRHELIARMDTDDICVSERFALQLQAFEQQPELALCGGQIIEFNNSIQDITGRRVVPCKEDDIRKWAQKRNPFNHVTVMYKKEVILGVGNYEECLYMEDYYLWIKVLKGKYRVANLEKTLVYVRAGDGLISRRGGMEYLKRMIQGKYKILQTGYITKINFLMGVSMHIIVSLLPKIVRGCFYSNFLRKREEYL